MTNEKKFKTPEERLAAFREYCDRHREKFNGCTIGNCPLRTTSTRACQFFWLALEAEEEKPLACPFCGGDNIDIFETDFGRSEEPYQFAVKCKSCGALVSAEDKGICHRRVEQEGEMNLNGKTRDISGDAKTKDVLSRIEHICKEKKLRFVKNAKMAGSNGSMFTDGRAVFASPLNTFPSAEAIALSFCHELAHGIVWKEQKAGTPRCYDKFDEELTAWSIGIGLWHKLFCGLRMRTFSRNYPLRRYVMSRLATYAGMFNISYEGFYWNGKPQVFIMQANGLTKRSRRAK